LTRFSAKILLFAVLLGSCTTAVAQPNQDTVRAALADAAYRCPVIVRDEVGSAFEDGFTLRDGKYEAPPDPPDSDIRPTATLDPDHVASGDLNGDGRIDAAAVVWEYGGGTGSFAVLYVLDDVLGSRRCTHSIGLGDRINLQRVDIVDRGSVLAEFTKHGPDQGMAEVPTQSVARKFLLSADFASATDRQADGSWQPYRSKFWHVVHVPLSDQAKPATEPSAYSAPQKQPARPAMPQPVLVPNDFPAPAASRDLEARVHTAIRGPTFLFGDTGDSFRAMRDSPQKGPHRLNDYIKNLRVYARDDGQLEIRFNIVPDDGDTFIWPSQIPARLFVRLFDQNGIYLTHFMTRESFAPVESIVRELTTGAIGVVNPSPVLLLDSDGKSNVLVYTVNARDLDYARIAEVGFYLRPVNASEMRGVPEDERWVPQGARRPAVSCTDYMECLAPKAGLRSPSPSSPSGSAQGAPQPTPTASPKKCRITQPLDVWSMDHAMRFFASLDQAAGPLLTPEQIAQFEAAQPICSFRPGEIAYVQAVRTPFRFFAVGRNNDQSCIGITLRTLGFECPS